MGRRPPRALGLPSIGIGNLSVGGSGKTPLASWIARYCLDEGRRPGIVLRPYGGGDEARVHEREAPGAVIIADADRVRGAGSVQGRGAEVVIFDDAFQRTDIRPDLNVVVMAAEASRAARWLMPAGPWRESRSALRRADLVVVTRKRAGADVAQEYAASLGPWLGDAPVAICELGMARLQGMITGESLDVEVVRGRRVLLSAGIGNPRALAAQLSTLGAEVQLVGWDDHHRYDQDEITWLAGLSQKADYVVVTEKDAVKLRGRWPADRVEPLVAMLELGWESGGDAVRRALDAILGMVS